MSLLAFEFKDMMLFFIIIFLLFLFVILKQITSKVAPLVKKRKVSYKAEVINKREYLNNELKLYYLEFNLIELDEKKEFVVDKVTYLKTNIGASGVLVLLDDYYLEFK